MMPIVIWTLAFLGLAGFFAWQLCNRWKLIKQMRSDDGRDYSSASYGQRFKNVLIYGFGQKKFFSGDQPAGILHVFVFWGFLVLGPQVVTMFVRGWFPSFSLPGMHVELIAGPYGLLKDIFQILVLVGVALAASRWLITKPERLMGYLPAEKKLRSQKHGEAVLILFFITLIMLSGFFYDAGRFAYLADIPLWEMAWAPVTAAISQIFPDAGVAQLASEAGWWIHNLVILVFLNLLPRSKHFHVITALPNVFLGRVEPKGKLAKKDLEAEDAIFGRSVPTHFTWKQVLDMYSCTECGRCSSVCPATASGKVLAPRQFLLNLRDNLYSHQPKLISASGNAAEELDVIVGDDKAVIDDVIWSCNACRACEQACPVNIEYIDKIVDIRQHLVQEMARFPAELNTAFKGLENQSNPWGISASERAAWAQGLDVPTLQENPNAEYLYYVGCGGAFDNNNKRNSQALVKILNHAKVNYAILGSDELCNGETARRLGNEYLYQTMAQMLVETINGAGIKKILVNCPHCFNTFKNEYPDFGADWEIIRAAQFVKQLVAEGKVKVQGSGSSQTVVYHDSCYYGRMNDVYEEPRTLLGKIDGMQLKEMNQSKANAKCCGAGGGRMWLEEDKDKRVNIDRAEQALEQKPDVIATSCPFCKIMIGSAINEKGKENDVKVMDVMEIVANNMQE